MTKRLTTALIALIAMLNGAAAAQWYQGPSGGTGGKPFDTWEESSHATRLLGFSILATGSIRCIIPAYRETPTNPGRLTAFRYGSCGEGRAEDWQTWQTQGFDMDSDEYLIGIAGTFGSHINSIRFYTSKRNWAPTKGSKSGKPFGYTAPSGQRIVAIFGRAGNNLDSIGVMYAPIPSPAEPLMTHPPKQKP